MSFFSVVCCQVEVSASRRSLLQRSPTYRGVSECDRKASSTRRPWHTGGCRDMNKNIYKSALNSIHYCCVKFVKPRNIQHGYLVIILLSLDDALVQKIRDI